MTRTTKTGSKPNAEARPTTADVVLESMRPVVHLIAGAFGQHCEVILHDFRTPNASIIEIAGNLTDREKGDPVNEINRWLLSQGREVRAKTVELVRTPRGRTLKSSRTMFRDETGVAFGCLCINLDVTGFLAVSRGIADMVGMDEATSAPPKVRDDIEYVVQTVLASEEARSGQRLDIAVPADRLAIFSALHGHGVFELKRAVPRLAAHFGLSRATIYSYLKQVG